MRLFYRGPNRSQELGTRQPDLCECKGYALEDGYRILHAFATVHSWGEAAYLNSQSVRLMLDHIVVSVAQLHGDARRRTTKLLS